VVVEQLREAGEKPSCLVQHQSELRSPLAIAHSRRNKAFRRLLSANGSSESMSTLTFAKNESELSPQWLPTPAAPRSSSPVNVKYGLSVYPYHAQRPEELDLEYGSVYLIVSRVRRPVDA
jgi:hypothetical protein